MDNDTITAYDISVVIRNNSQNEEKDALSLYLLKPIKINELPQNDIKLKFKLAGYLRKCGFKASLFGFRKI